VKTHTSPRDCVTKPITTALNKIVRVTMSILPSLRLPACFPQRFDVCRPIVEPPKSIKEPAVGSRVDQCTPIVLAMDFDERTADLFEHLHAHWLIVDKSAGASIGQLHTPKDQLVLRRNI